jgi:cysteine desulfuration protein SufE
VSDAVIVKGLVALMLQILNDRTQVEIQNFDIDLLKELGIKGLLTPGRQNGVSSLIQRIQLLAA